MLNKIFYISALIAIILSTFINHKMYGNSNSTMSNYEVAQNIHRNYIKQKKAKVIADYMYKRIKFYQQFDTWYERQDTFWNMYEALQKME